MDPQSLYLNLTQLALEMPELGGRGRHPQETYRWLGRATELVRATGNSGDTIGIASASESLGASSHGGEDIRITAIFFRALAHAEAQAPAGIRSAVIVAGASFNAAQVIRRVLSEASHVNGRQELLFSGSESAVLISGCSGLP